MPSHAIWPPPDVRPTLTDKTYKSLHDGIIRYESAKPGRYCKKCSRHRRDGTACTCRTTYPSRPCRPRLGRIWCVCGRFDRHEGGQCFNRDRKYCATEKHKQSGRLSSSYPPPDFSISLFRPVWLYPTYRSSFYWRRFFTMIDSTDRLIHVIFLIWVNAT